jgi:hypothetical protein
LAIGAGDGVKVIISTAKLKLRVFFADALTDRASRPEVESGSGGRRSSAGRDLVCIGL